MCSRLQPYVLQVRLFGQSTLMKLGDQRRVLATGTDSIDWNLTASAAQVEQGLHVLQRLMQVYIAPSSVSR